ncbi:KEOPS complex subunit Pcc1 [Nitrososphaera sp.]|uniref:KEOPS complex subunit Pcc1 n=1 Tax=Nitrososphaera sp. TaxID=1971748 RepID=UPI002EDAF846
MTKNLRRLEVEIAVQVQFPSALQARAAVKALIPDNVNLPEGLTLSMFSRGRTVYVAIGSRRSMMAAAASTLDEILDHISVSRKVMAQGG